MESFMFFSFFFFLINNSFIEINSHAIQYLLKMYNSMIFSIFTVI